MLFIVAGLFLALVTADLLDLSARRGSGGAPRLGDRGSSRAKLGG
jgi:hypothetical protein